MTSRQALFVVTSHDRLGDGDEPTGLWAEELTTPYYVLSDAGIEVTIASIAGGRIPFDPRSIAKGDGNPATVRRFLDDPVAMAKADESVDVATVRFAAYDAIFLPGGHGTMWDLPESGPLAAGIGGMFDAGKIVAAVCHGVAGFVSARRQDGQPIVAGRRVNAFTDAEEAAVGLADKVPFLLEARLRELGARFESSANFQPFAIRDDNLITGQNPMSSDLVARHVLAALGTRATA